jgi:hypothetical protein
MNLISHGTGKYLKGHFEGWSFYTYFSGKYLKGYFEEWSFYTYFSPENYGKW